ncbi:MAG: sigma-54-dependent Fis family transcriptional regulator [Planctomycetes bacterium]|nr:sigma-54-dependent Fis family transcriptional regulator [Planctomycetota bacterium]
MALILIVDDEQPLLQSLSLEMRRAGHDCLIAETGAEAFALLEKNSPDLAILDVRLPDVSGLDVLRHLKNELPEVPVVMVTAFASVDSAVEAMKDGATDYLEKPLDLEELQLVVTRELRNARLVSEVEVYRRGSRRSAESSPLIGASSVIQEIRNTIARIGAAPVSRASELPSILLLGETGSGKDLIARHLHGSSGLADRPFVQVNCSGLPRDLVESELFGHEKGAFTNAGQRKQGLFEIARGGTIFLDEIGDMPLDIQAKLLNVLEHRRVRRVGGTRDYHVEARIIAATNVDLEEAVDRGEFRADLFYRIRVVTLSVPPLRDRLEDLGMLAEFFLDRFRTKYRKPDLRFSDEILDAFRAWDWPGNVRELAHTIEQMVLLSNDDALRPPTFPRRARAIVTAPAFPDATRDVGLTLQLDFDRGETTLENVERRLILEALQHTGGNVSEVARILGVSRGALRHRMAKWGISA